MPSRLLYKGDYLPLVGCDMRVQQPGTYRGKVKGGEGALYQRRGGENRRFNLCERRVCVESLGSGSLRHRIEWSVIRPELRRMDFKQVLCSVSVYAAILSAAAMADFRGLF